MVRGTVIVIVVVFVLVVVVFVIVVVFVFIVIIFVVIFVVFAVVIVTQHSFKNYQTCILRWISYYHTQSYQNSE